MAATFLYWKSRDDNQYYFRLREDGNGKTILASTEGYVSEQGCLNGIRSTKTNAPFDSNYTRINGSDGQFYFTLRAGNYEPISRSEGYSTVSNREQGIENCKREAPLAGVKEI